MSTCTPAVTTTELFLIAMAIIFSVPYLVWRLGRTEYWAPLVVVQIVTGILLGPGVLGAAFPEYYQFVFTQDVIQSLNGVAWWAVMLFVWIAGIELTVGHAADGAAGDGDDAGDADGGDHLRTQFVRQLAQLFGTKAPEVGGTIDGVEQRRFGTFGHPVRFTVSVGGSRPAPGP